jgi:membrane protein DedA with SNARE-associated domain
MNEVAEWIQQYGYVAIFLGTFVEGESIALLGGFLAHGELLDLPLVMIVTFIGAFCGDQTAFWLGRRYGSRWEPKSAMVQRRRARAEVLLNRYQVPVLLGFRFVYGIRNATPFVAGSITAIGWPRFVLLNAAGALIWAASIPAIGYYFGQTAEALLGSSKTYEVRVLAALISGGLLIASIRYLRARRLAARAIAADVENPPRKQ